MTAVPVKWKRKASPIPSANTTGFDTSDYSFGYVAGWSSGKELAELRGSLETIRNTAAEMINAIDGHFAELQKAQVKEQAQPQHEDNPPEQPEAAPPEKAAFTPETIYRVRRNPYSDREENTYLLQAYVTQENGRAKMGEVLFRGTPEKCRELLGQLNAGELTQGEVQGTVCKGTGATGNRAGRHLFHLPVKGRGRNTGLPL